MYEFYLKKDSECYYLVASKVDPSLPTLIFIHGLGDSSVSYHSFLTATQLTDFNIFIPDLLGYGKSSATQNYSFSHQVEAVIAQINDVEEKLNVRFKDIILIAHSMGGIHATLLCESALKNRIKGFINVEGSITQYGSFIAETVMKIANKDRLTWLNQFKESIFQKSNTAVHLRSYYASLLFCHPETFFHNAIEMRELSLALPEKFSHVIGEKYSALTLPKIYCYGDTLAKETIDFLILHNLEKKHFICDTHFVMSECNREFIVFLKEFITSIS